MATPVVIPREGQSMENGIIIKWYARVGEKVAFGQPLCEVESEKVTFEIESPVDGILLEILYHEGQIAPVLTAIAVLGKPGEDYTGLKQGSVSNMPDHKGISKQEIMPEPDNKQQMISDKILISPRARKLAQVKNIPVHLLQDTLMKGTPSKSAPITEKDVMEYLQSKYEMTPAAREYMEKSGMQPPSAGTGIGGRITVDDMIRQDAANEPTGAAGTAITGMRKVIGDRMLHSLQATAQFTLNSYADATELLAFRKRLKSSSIGLEKITVNDMILFAVSKALAVFPELNAHFSDGRIKKAEAVNLGFAVDVPVGLMVPVIHNADKLSLKQISDMCKSLALACREGRAGSQELKGGTFTVSNLGSFGIESFTPILNYPEVGILGVGTIAPRPVRINGEIEFIDHIAFSLTVNHQVIDGAVGARFLRLITDYLRNVDILLAV